ncbi:hypothetical protein [uncultured Rikenella sp.]|uniref:hypothetical protein n=1 Tax=uncultured Rikenella sp. TaxID=368003 RepID=UPI002612651B|nr:hypothetical protein [uncultured Rikenella sp.]
MDADASSSCLKLRAGPTSRGRAKLRFAAAASAQSFVRALAEILFKAQDALNDFLIQQSRAEKLCPASNCSFSEEKEPKRLSTDACASSSR